MLRGFVLTLGLGLPVILALAVGGGSLLVQQALRAGPPGHRRGPGDHLHNLSQRLPVPRTGDEIEHLSLALNEMIGRLDEAFQHAGRFTADASHELRTPLTVMRGELESVVQDGVARSAHAGADRLACSRRRSAWPGSSRSLLAISRLEAGEALLERIALRPLEPRRHAPPTRCRCSPRTRGSRSRCLGDECVEVEGDPARLKQVVVNLLDNAVKYTPRGGRDLAGDPPREGRAVLEVADTGPGIPEVALPRVFDRFFRADGMRAGSGEGGAGLGLAIVRLICAAHGGTVSVGNDRRPAAAG